jgi:hypothetical protein
LAAGRSWPNTGDTITSSATAARNEEAKATFIPTSLEVCPILNCLMQFEAQPSARAGDTMNLQQS